MESNNRKIQITLYRIAKPERTFTEGLIIDNGIGLKTKSILTKPEAQELTNRFLERGWFHETDFIYSVST